MEEKQRLRIERVGIAVSGSLLMSAMALGMAWAGYFPMHAAVIYAAVTAAICAVFYALIRSGRNLRFADPNLSAAQLVSAALTISYAVYESGDARPVFLAVYLLAYAFGAFALRPRALVFVALFYLACHAAVIGLLLLLRPAVTDLRYELVQFFVFLVMMGWTSYVAIYVSRLRRESRRSTAALKSETDERLKVASARQLADARYRELFESVVDGMIISQPDGLILDANQAICRRFGYHREELIGRNVRDLVDPQELAAHPMREDMTRKWGRRERKLLARDGGNTPTEVVAGPMPDGNVLSILRDITERKLAEEDQLRFRMAMDASADMILLVDRETMRFVDANSTICRLLGYSREELLALPPEQILPVSRAELEEAYDRQIADPSTPGGLTSYYLCKDGSRLPFESKRQVLRIGGRYVISISSRDIRERLQAENALRESERRLRANRRLLEIVIDAIPMSIFVKDTNSNYVMVNNYMTEFFETSKETMTSLHTSKLPTHEATRLQSIEDDQRVYRDRKTFTHETLIQRPDGSPVPFHSSKIPLFDDAGALIGLLGVNRDISEEQRAREQIERINVELEERVEARTSELRTALKDLDSFAYSVSHDLRAPVGAVSGFAHLLRSNEASKLSDDGRHLLGMIEHNAERMGNLIEGLLRLSRLGRSQINRSRISMDSLVRDALRVHPHAQDADIRIGPLPECDGDAVLLGQVWANLLGNALKYSRTRRPAQVEAGWDPEKKAYFVRDNGIGFDMRYAPKLFGVFERLHSDPEFEGSGIGLAIVRRIIERHGGDVWAEGAVDQGATIWFTVSGAG